MNAKERNEGQIECPRCGADAEWSFLDPDRTTVEILCSDCGRFEMSREEFDRVAAERAGFDESRRE
jgi:transcription elongation factor Elf1